MTELIDGLYYEGEKIADTKAPHSVPIDRRWEQRVELMRDTIIYNRNNPSVIFWESGNKGISETHMKEMRAVRDKYDPHGGRAAGSREMLDSKTAEYGGEMLYINKSSRIPLWMMEYSRDEGLRKYWDEFSPPLHKTATDRNIKIRMPALTIAIKIHTPSKMSSAGSITGKRVREPAHALMRAA